MIKNCVTLKSLKVQSYLIWGERLVWSEEFALTNFWRESFFLQYKYSAPNIPNIPLQMDQINFTILDTLQKEIHLKFSQMIKLIFHQQQMQSNLVHEAKLRLIKFERRLILSTFNWVIF